MQRSEVIARLGPHPPAPRTPPNTPLPHPQKVTPALNAAREGQRGDPDLNPGMHPTRALTGAAVLVPLIDRPDGMTVLLTKRTEHLTDHAGQVSFPGGRIDPEDRDAAAAALREAKEEV